jgi:hypothetical protein
MATASERWKRRTFRDRIKKAADAFGILVFYSPLIALYYIDFDETSETTFRLLGIAWLLGIVLPSLLASSIFERIERREYEEFEKSEQAGATNRGNGR